MNKLIHGPSMGGQSLADRVSAAKHSIAGQGLAKSVCKASTEEVLGPKKKHLDYLLQCTNEPNVSIPQLANLLIERTQNSNWVVVYKSLVTIHNMMNYGNERFTQYLASNNCTFNLNAFLDKQGVQGYDMSTYIRRYAKYLNEKAFSYRTMAFDFCKVKRGKDDGLLRTMNTEKLLKSLPILQQQVDALLEFDVTPNELTNGVINACFMLLFKDLIRLFACYNDGIINLLEKYFDMTKKNCREALDLYKRFLVRMERTAEFLKVCESVGIDKGDIPDLAKAPSSLLEALEEHLKSLESAKKSGQPAPKPAAKIATEISTFAAAATSGVNAAVISDEEKRRIIEEESKQLEQLKQEQKLKDKASPSDEQPAGTPNPFSTAGNTQVTGSVDLFGANSPTNPVRPSDDLLNLGSAPASNPFAAAAVPSNNPFAANVAATNAAGAGSPWGSPAIQGQKYPGQPQAPAVQNGTSNNFASDANFDRAFGNQQKPANSASGFDGFGDILQPNPGQLQKSAADQKLIGRDLDTSLASLAGNLRINPSQQVKKMDHQWNQTNTNSGERKMTGASSGGGPNWSSSQSYNQPMAMGGASDHKSSSLETLMTQYHTHTTLQTPNIYQTSVSVQSRGAPVMGAMPAAGAQPGYQQPGQPGMMAYQPQMGINMPRQPQPMGMIAQPGGQAMFPPQQPVGQAQGQSGSFGGQSASNQANDPFGAL